MDVKNITVALVRKPRGSLMCLAYLLTCYPWVFVQPGTGSRHPTDLCRNKMSVLRTWHFLIMCDMFLNKKISISRLK